MFTGIVETLGVVEHVQEKQANLEFGIKADFIEELEVDQSIAHNGVCLTIETLCLDYYTVTAIKETIGKTNLAEINAGDRINLERCLKANSRLDGHIVQGHVDQTAACKNIVEENGSWIFTFEYQKQHKNYLVEKGSVCINGVSLTLVNVSENSFSTAIIPYTFEHTNFHLLQIEDLVNLEFDILGKYVERVLGNRR
ncbi:MAG TPA: riboflavin synthase [Flavobacteriales bacterium]|nr:riboflavin synthase [Flavobacteriales bacterium]